MATAIRSLSKVQVGIETTKGTLVPATRVLAGNWSWSEEQEFYRAPYPAGIRANVGGAGVILRKGMTLDAEMDLSAEQILWPLLTGIKGAVTGQVTDTSAYTYTFAPELTTGIPTLDTLTAEMILGDGSTNHYAREAGYGVCRSFKLAWAFNQVAKLNAQWFLRAGQTSTPTGSLVTYTTLEPLVANLLAVYLDTTWAGLGGTQLTGIVRSADLDVVTGHEPDYTLDARSDKDFTIHKVGPVRATLNLTMEMDAVGAARVANFRANDVVFIRLKNTGTLAGAATAYRTVQVDGAYRFTGPPSFSEDGEQVLVAMSLESVYDSTGAKSLEFTAINKLSAVT